MKNIYNTYIVYTKLRGKTNMNKKSIKSVVTIALVLCFMSANIVFAAYNNWTTTESTHISSNASSTSNHYSVKYTNNSQFGVYVTDKTMWSNPKADLVTSAGSSRSNKLSLDSTGKYLYGTGNIAEKNHKVWLRITPAFNQVGTDLITYKFSAR